MTESELEDQLQSASNIDKIRKAVAKVKNQRDTENSNELDFNSLDYEGGDNEH